MREAETFRNDYRNTTRRAVFHALSKPLPWAGPRPKHTVSDVFATGDEDEIETQRYCGAVLMLFVITCLGMTAWILARQSRMTR